MIDERAADISSNGHSERTLGQSFKNLGVPRKDVVLATKVWMLTTQQADRLGAVDLWKDVAPPNARD